MITPFDLILILIVFSFVLFGLWFGLIHALGGLLGTLVGAIIAMKYYTKWASSNLYQVVSFIVLFTLGSRLTAFVFYLIERVFKLTQIIPGIKTINRLAGGLLGLAEGSIVVGIALIFASKFPFPSLVVAVDKSEIAQFLIGVGTVVLPLFPEVLRQVKEAVDVMPQ